MTNDRKLAIRIPRALCDQAETIRANMAPKGRKVKTSAVLRMAIERGLAVLRSEHAASTTAGVQALSASAMATHEALKARILAKQSAGR